MNTMTDGILIIGLTTALSVAGMFLVRRNIDRATLEACHEVGGVMFAVIGTLYAIVVGLIVVSSEAKVDDAGKMAVTEANQLSNMFHLAATFKQPACDRIRKSIHDYAVAVVNQDWTKVETGEETEATIPSYQALWHEITSYVPERGNDSQAYATMLTNMEDLSSARRYRMVEARNKLSPILWTVLVGGGIMVILFTYFFFVESIKAQAIMTTFVALSLSMNVYLIYVCQNPYRPEFGVKKSGFGFSFTPKWFAINNRDTPNYAVQDPKQTKHTESKGSR